MGEPNTHTHTHRLFFTWSIIIVDTNWQISGHVGHRIPTFNGEIDTDVFFVQLQKQKKKNIFKVNEELSDNQGRIEENTI